jgi:putative peptidoglycan lipid II flippase
MSLLKIESYKKGLVLSTAFNLVAKFLLFAQNIVIVYYFGNNIKTDLFFFLFSTLTIVTFFINSLDYSVLIPESMRKLEQENKSSSMRFLNFFIITYTILGIVLIIPILVKPVFFLSYLSNFQINDLHNNSFLIVTSAPLFFLMILVNLLSNILTSYRFFTIPVISSTINSIICLLFVFTLHGSLGETSIFLGLLSANSLNLIILIVIFIKKLDWDFFLLPQLPSRIVLKNILYAQLGNFSTMFSNYIPLYLLSGMNAGIITSLTLGQKTAEMPGNLINSQFSSVVGIKLNELNAKKDRQQSNEIFQNSIKILIFIMVPISSILFFFSEEIVRLLFFRGEFSEDAVKTTAIFFKYFSLALPLYSVNSMVAKLFMADQKIKEAFWFQTLLNIFYIGILFYLTSVYGEIGFPFSVILLYLAIVTLIYFLIQKHFPYIEYKKTLIYFAKIIFMNFFISGTIFYAFHAYNNYELYILMVTLSVNILILLLLNHLFRINTQIHLIIIQLFKRLKSY